ncbi:MAG: hypothetical protein ACLS89_01900, partial [Collinsella sp.]
MHGTCLRVARGRRGDDKLSKFSQSPRVGLDALFDSTVSICIEQLAQILDLAAILAPVSVSLTMRRRSAWSKRLVSLSMSTLRVSASATVVKA